jgi:predicted DNA-binding protein
MIRTQVYLTKDLYQTIDLLSKREKKPKAQVIRETLVRGMEKRRKKNASEALLELAKLGEKLNIKGPTDLSVNHDKYYEEA